MKVTIDGFVNYTTGYDSETGKFDAPRYSVETFSMAKTHGYLEVCPIKLELEIPDDWNPQKGEIEALIVARDEAIEKHEVMLAKIDKRLSELTAIEYTVEA